MSRPRPEREQKLWVVIASLAIVGVVVGILNLARLALLGTAVALPEHLAPWATRAGDLNTLVREEAELRVLGDPGYEKTLLYSRNRDRTEREYFERYLAEVQGEVELIQRIVALSGHLGTEGAAPSPGRQREVLQAHLAAARAGVLIPDEQLHDELSGEAPLPAPSAPIDTETPSGS